MIWDIDSPSWWKRTIPYKDGLPVTRWFNHRAKGWFLVVDPFSTVRVYWADRARNVWRFSPPPRDSDTGTQTLTDLAASYHSEAESQTESAEHDEAECQTESADHDETECQTIGLFGSDLPADVDVWSTLGSSVAGLPSDRQAAIYDRLVRFLDLGLLDLRNQSP